MEIGFYLLKKKKKDLFIFFISIYHSKNLNINNLKD